MEGDWPPPDQLDQAGSCFSPNSQTPISQLSHPRLPLSLSGHHIAFTAPILFVLERSRVNACAMCACSLPRGSAARVRGGRLHGPLRHWGRGAGAVSPPPAAPCACGARSEPRHARHRVDLSRLRERRASRWAWQPAKAHTPGPVWGGPSFPAAPPAGGPSIGRGPIAQCECGRPGRRR